MGKTFSHPPLTDYVSILKFKIQSIFRRLVLSELPAYAPSVEIKSLFNVKFKPNPALTGNEVKILETITYVALGASNDSSVLSFLRFLSANLRDNWRRPIMLRCWRWWYKSKTTAPSYQSSEVRSEIEAWWRWKLTSTCYRLVNPYLWLQNEKFRNFQLVTAFRGTSPVPSSRR